MKRKVKKQVTGFRTSDGAGVKLVRVLGEETIEDFDPILMLDSFDSSNPDDYTAGFPEHPHRGIETISYIYKGKMVHKDSLGNEDGITDGEVQWMTAGSGILHEEKLPASDQVLGVQLWLNLPSKDKFSPPSYRSIKNQDIKEIEFDGGVVRLLAGSYKGHEGHKGNYLPLDYYDIHLKKDAIFKTATEPTASIMIFTLKGDIYIDDTLIKEKTAVKLTDGDSVEIKSIDDNTQVLFMKSVALNEPIWWGGPIVMHTHEELMQAFKDLKEGTFIKEKINY